MRFFSILALAVALAVGPAPSVAVAASAPAIGSATASAYQYRGRRYPDYSTRSRSRYSRDKPRYYSFKTKRGATILCRTTWRGRESTRTCWPRH